MLRLFAANDMDPYDVEDIHPEVRAAMRQAGIELAEPERYAADAQSATPTVDPNPWWRPW